MATVPITVPSVGESITEGILSRWLVADGASIQEGEPLFELETDKASTPVPAPATGRLKIDAAEGATVEIGSVVGSLDPAAAGAAAPAAAPSTAATAPAAAVASDAAPIANGGPAPGGDLAPSVRRLVAENQVDASKVEGTGRGGRLTKGDVLAHIDGPKGAATAAATPPVPAAKPPAPAPTSAAPAAVAAAGARETRKKMSNIRQTIAKRLVEAQRTAAILTTFNEADLSKIIELRGRYKDPFKAKHSVNLGFMSFFVKATIEALKAFPAVNGRVDGTDIVFNNVYDIGVAVSTERGLVVPVIRDADRLGFAGIEKAIGGFAAKAREGTIPVSDMMGGTFTITNGGVFGSLLSTPILNMPQSGILGMHTIQQRPVAVDGQVVIRPMMYLALSYDHRIVDGREAVGFLVKVKECVENPEKVMLEL